MQTTLLGVAIAIILALVTALVAPLVIDWNHYRGAVEAEASRLSGLNVHVTGPIDARLLPSPVITLHDVEAGDFLQHRDAAAGALVLVAGADRHGAPGALAFIEIFARLDDRAVLADQTFHHVVDGFQVVGVMSVGKNDPIVEAKLSEIFIITQA